jgi:DNA polymerase (family 10)
MAAAAKAAGLSYIAVTDHTKSLAFVGGLDERAIVKQAKEIAKINTELKGFRVLRGTECDILKDGALDLSDRALASLEWVGVSIHSHFGLSRAAQTARIVQAIAHPAVDCLFHPTCRLIGKREGIDVDMEEILAAAKKYRVALEINAFPDRSDLRDIHVRAAIRAGVMLVINSDAHAPEHLRYLPLGEAIARRGWAEKKHILNTKSLKDLLAYLDKKRKRT